MAKSLAKNSIYNIIYTVINLAYPLVTSMYVSRIILTDGVGKVAFAQSIVSYFVTFAGLGLPIYGLREIAKTREGRAETNKLFSELFLINSFATTIALGIYAGLIFLFNPFKNLLPLYISCGLLIFFNYFNIDWLYKGLEEYGYILIRSLIIKSLSLVALFIFVKDVDDFTVFALISSIATGSNHIFNSVHARKYVSFTFRGLKFKRHLIPVLILAGSVMLESVYGKIDVTMLGAMVSDSSTGLYNYAHKTITLLISTCTAITTVFMPKLSYYYKYDVEKFHNTLRLGLKVLTFISIPFMVGVIILSQRLMVLLYGSNFSLAGFTLCIFSPLVVISSFSDILCYQLPVSIGHEMMRLPAALIGTVVNIILNLILIPLLQEKGAAMASVISESLISVFIIFALRKYIKISYDFRALIQALISTAIMAGVVIGICYIPMPNIAICIVAVCAGVGVYLLSNLIMKNELCIMIKNRVFGIICRKSTPSENNDFEDDRIAENSEDIEDEK